VYTEFLVYVCIHYVLVVSVFSDCCLKVGMRIRRYTNKRYYYLFSIYVHVHISFLIVYFMVDLFNRKKKTYTHDTNTCKQAKTDKECSWGDQD